VSSVFSAAEKWDEPWYGILSIEAKVLYDYLYDTADNAGFKPQNFHIWSAYTGLTESEIESALEELKEVVIIENDLAWLKDHLKFNRNVDINTQNPAKAKVRKTFEENENHKAAFCLYSSLIESTCLDSTKPLNQGLKQGLDESEGLEKGKKPRTTRSTEGFKGRIVEIICPEHTFIRETHKVGSGSIDKYCTKCAKPMERIILKSEMNRSSLSAS
jgi:hypothetical protein